MKKRFNLGLGVTNLELSVCARDRKIYPTMAERVWTGCTAVLFATYCSSAGRNPVRLPAVDMADATKMIEVLRRLAPATAVVVMIGAAVRTVLFCTCFSGVQFGSTRTHGTGASVLQ